MSRRTVFDVRDRGRCGREHDEPGRCPGCRAELIVAGGESPKRYCSTACRKEIARLPIPERAERRESATDGLCVACGVELPARVYVCPRRRMAAVRKWRRAAGGQLRYGEDARAWLAEKLGAEDLDRERANEIALALAEAGRLTVLVQDGRVQGVAKVREP